MMDMIVPKGITPLCGWDWIRQHQHDLDDWRPSIEIARPGSNYKIEIRDTKVIDKVIREITKQ